MAYDDIEIFDVFSEHFCGFIGDELMGCPVEPITADAVFVIVLSWNSVEEGFFRHRLVKRSIKHCHHRLVLHQFLACFNPDQGSWVVERCEYVACLDLF